MEEKKPKAKEIGYMSLIINKSMLNINVAVG